MTLLDELRFCAALWLLRLAIAVTPSQHPQGPAFAKAIGDAALKLS
jgi:hypothetical protein